MTMIIIVIKIRIILIRISIKITKITKITPIYGIHRMSSNRDPPKSPDKGLHLSKGPYLHWSTDGPIAMEGLFYALGLFCLYTRSLLTVAHTSDIVEDGLSPDQRAALHQPLHVMLKVRVKNARHLPRVNHLEFGSDPYVSISYFDEIYETQHVSSTLNAEFTETFDIFVHSAERTLALDHHAGGAAMHSRGPSVKCEVWDWNRTLAHKLIGTNEMRLEDLFSSTFPVEHTLQIFDADGFAVSGSDGNPTTITIGFDAEEIESDRPRWTPPTLEETLQCSEGLIRLQRAHRSRVPSFRASTDTWRLGMVGAQGDSKVWSAEAQDDYDEHGANMEALIRAINQSKQGIHWRERLNEIMESLWASLAVIVLIILDLTCIIFFDIMDDDPLDNPIEQSAIAGAVLGFFMIELFLRALAQRMRFWRQMWNIFDVIIILASVVIFVVNQVFLELDLARSTEINSAYSSVLRALSRAAMALRVVRILIKLRQTRKLSGDVRATLRTAVSQNRRRYLQSYSHIYIYVYVSVHICPQP